ncbi:MAG: alpha-N-arabinofuranosidase, partial [Rhodospirillales bacterium]|nr:alpha-N-arabinofuranosidase [Acetobacter sp.]
MHLSLRTGRSSLVRRSAIFGMSLFAGSLLFPAPVARAQGKTGTAQLVIEPKAIVSPVSPMLYGMMTEEINHAFDGGLYAEMVQNRTFRGTWEGVQHWDLVRRGEASAKLDIVKDDGPSKALTNSVKVTVTNASAGSEAGLSNTGYWGMGLKPRTQYKGSFYAKVDSPEIGPVMARLVSDNTGAVVAEAKVMVKAGDWSPYTYTMTTNAAANGSANHLEILVAHSGTISLQLVSLFPPTFNNQSNGFRPELMERMAGLHPHFLRLPGGNYLEGDQLKDWFNWKTTLGP